MKKISLFLLFLIVLGFAIPVSGQEGDTFFNADAMAKIHPNLMQDIETALGTSSIATPMSLNQLSAATQSTGTGEAIEFMARIQAGTDLSPYSEQWFARPFVDPLGETVAVGLASPNAILKMATLPEVVALQRPESLVELPQPVDPDVQDALNTSIEPAINLDGDAIGPAPEGWHHTTIALHASQEAWAKGFTGAGVRYMSNDSGADYCHADLLGTWAYIDDPASPYYGLPEMFDSFSSYYAAYDYYLGYSLIASGRADYADTSATASGDFSYAPLGAAAAHDYTVPGTSLSGVYHYGSHPDKLLASNADVLSGAFGDGTAVAGERAAILVVDENTAGVYDTVYVDLNFNYDFSDDSPARLSRDFSNSEAACLDYDLDGLNDVSGGLVYFISDGVTAVPTLDWFWGVPGSAYGNGDLVAFHVMDATEGGGDHGMGTTSVATGQGVVRGSIYWGAAGSPIADYQGLVLGPGKDVASTQNGNFYVTPFVEDAYFYATLGYDGTPGTGDDIQIVSNSWGYSGTDNDGFDHDSRLIDSINRTYGPNTTLLFSTGNGAPGYGTVSPPSPSTSIGVGASTQYGSIGVFETIESEAQIVGGDVESWSNRGPGVLNNSGADVVATGAWGTGDIPLNEILDGSIATADFGGTSMAAPVAAGNLALIYQAWYENHGAWPTYQEAAEVLMGSSKNTGHDVWAQGAGLVDADTGTDVAAGLEGINVSPAQWSVGDYRGEEYEAFAHIIEPGGQDTQEFTITNTSDKWVIVQLSSNSHRLIGSVEDTITTKDQSLEHGLFTIPDYVYRIDPYIPKGTDLLQVQLTKPYEQFNPTFDLTASTSSYSNWRVHLQDWTDLNGDGMYWDDLNGNGVVDPDEMEVGEYIRFTYGYSYGPTQEVRMGHPLERINDGLLLTLRHRDRLASVPTTDLTFKATFWKFAKWDWVRSFPNYVILRPGQTKTVNLKMEVPRNTPYGMYEGSINMKYSTIGWGSHDVKEVVVPVTVAVAASGTSFDFGAANNAYGQDWRHRYGYSRTKYVDRPMLYENDAVFGYTDYGWRAESGDWRFFWTDIAADDLPPTGTSYLVVDNSWEGALNDLDTIILGPTADDYSPSPIYGPYTLEEVGRSNYGYLGSGRWLWETSSGGPREMVAAPAQEGLHAILFHQVFVDGSEISSEFGGSVGLVNLDPGAVAFSGAAGANTTSVTINSELDLSGFVAEGYGLGGPVTTTETVSQDDPNDPSSASFTTTVDIAHGALLEVDTDTPNSDIDLFIYDPTGSLVASSTTSTGVEHVSILFPEDGTYTIAVHGWSVPTGTDTFTLTINAVQGYDVSVSNLPSAVPAGGSASFDVTADTTGFAPGTYSGLILLGPAEGPGLLQIPVTVTVE